MKTDPRFSDTPCPGSTGANPSRTLQDTATENAIGPRSRPNPTIPGRPEFVEPTARDLDHDLEAIDSTWKEAESKVLASSRAYTSFGSPDLLDICLVAEVCTIGSGDKK